MNPQEMRERAWTIVHEARNAWDTASQRDGGPTAEDEAALDRALEEARQLEERATRQERLEETERRMNEPGWRPTDPGGGNPGGEDEGFDISSVPEDVRSYLTRYMQRGEQQRHHVETTCASEYRTAFNRYLSVNDVTELTPDERRALSEGSDPDGGFLVPADVDTSMILRDPREPAVVRALATVRQTVRDRVILKTADRISMSWAGESETAPEQNTDFGEIEVVINKLLGLTKSSTEELEDAAFDVVGHLTEIYNEAAGFEEDKAAVTGNGVKKPYGILNGNRVTRVETAGSGTLAANDILSVYYQLPARYRRNSTWLFESLIELEVRKLKDSDGQYIWQPGLAGDRPASLLGRPIANPDEIMDTEISAGKEIAIIGDVRNYHIRDRVGTSVQRLDEKYADTDEVGFKVRRRVGGNVGVANAFRALKVKA